MSHAKAHSFAITVFAAILAIFAVTALAGCSGSSKNDPSNSTTAAELEAPIDTGDSTPEEDVLAAAEAVLASPDGFSGTYSLSFELNGPEARRIDLGGKYAFAEYDPDNVLLSSFTATEDRNDPDRGESKVDVSFSEGESAVSIDGGAAVEMPGFSASMALQRFGLTFLDPRVLEEYVAFASYADDGGINLKLVDDYPAFMLDSINDATGVLGAGEKSDVSSCSAVVRIDGDGTVSYHVIAEGTTVPGGVPYTANIEYRIASGK